MMMSISFVMAKENMKFSRRMKIEKSLRHKQTRKERHAISKDNSIEKKIMERDSQRHMTQEKHHEITIQSKIVSPKNVATHMTSTTNQLTTVS